MKVRRSEEKENSIDAGDVHVGNAVFYHGQHYMRTDTKLNTGRVEFICLETGVCDAFQQDILVGPTDGYFQVTFNR